MKLSGFFCLILFSALALCQSDLPALTAGKLTRDGPLLRASGHVQVKIAGLVLEADEGVQNQDKQTIELHGHALVKLPAGPPAWVLRCGPGRTIVATDPMTISADELAIAGGILRARGHIHTRKDLTVWTADEADFYLNAGDAEVRGNLLVNGVSPGPVTNRPRRFGQFSTPEIVR